MAANKEDADIDDILSNEEELEKALCVLAGSDPENCSYSRVRNAPCTASLQPSSFSVRLVAFVQVQVLQFLDVVMCVHCDCVCVSPASSSYFEYMLL